MKHEIELLDEHRNFLVAVNPDLAVALAEVLETYAALLKHWGTLAGQPRQDGLFPEIPHGKAKRKPPSGPAADLVRWFSEKAWPCHRGDGAVYEPKKRDFISAANLLQHHELREIEFRAENMLMRTSDYWRERASLHTLESDWNGLDREPNGK